jgi:hypothetical protein
MIGSSFYYCLILLQVMELVIGTTIHEQMTATSSGTMATVTMTTATVKNGAMIKSSSL